MAESTCAQEGTYARERTAENGQAQDPADPAGGWQDDFERAVRFALEAHRGQVRKGSEVPYIVHPMETSVIAMSLTKSRDVVLAALLHDVIEDTEYSVEDIAGQFGSRVAAMVLAESEDKRRGQSAAETWQMRKQEFIDSLDGMDYDGKVIALSDKLSNMRATYHSYRTHGEEFWQRFNEKRKEKHAWYYSSVLEKLRAEFAETDAWQELEWLIDAVFGSVLPL